MLINVSGPLVVTILDCRQSRLIEDRKSSPTEVMQASRSEQLPCVCCACGRPCRKPCPFISPKACDPTTVSKMIGEVTASWLSSHSQDYHISSNSTTVNPGRHRFHSSNPKFRDCVPATLPVALEWAAFRQEQPFRFSSPPVKFEEQGRNGR